MIYIIKLKERYNILNVSIQCVESKQQ